MPLAYLYWILMLLWLVLGLWGHWGHAREGDYAPAGGHLLLFFVLVVLGMGVFGGPIK